MKDFINGEISSYLTHARQFFFALHDIEYISNVILGMMTDSLVSGIRTDRMTVILESMLVESIYSVRASAEEIVRRAQ